MNQTALIPSGVSQQPNAVCASANYVAYTSTLVVYVHSTAPGFPLIRVLSGNEHEKCITAIAYDGQCFFTCDVGGRVFAWDADKGTVHKSFVDEKVQCRSIAASAMTRGIVVVGCDNMHLRVWNYGTGQVTPHSFGGVMSNNDSLCAVAFSVRQAALCAIGDTNGTLVLYDAIKCQTKRKLDVTEQFGTKEPAIISSLAFDPLSDNYLLIGCDNGYIALFDIMQYAVVQQFDKCNTGVVGMCWVPTAPGNFATVDGRTSVMRMWNASSKAPMHSRRPRNIPLGALCMVPSERPGGETKFFLAYDDGVATVYNYNTGRLEYSTLPGHTDTIFDCKFAHHNKNIVASGSHEGVIKIWDVSTMKLVKDLRVDYVVYCVEWSPEEEILVAALSNGYLVMCDVGMGRVAWKAETHRGSSCFRVAWSKVNPTRLASAGGDQDFYCAITDAATGNLIKRYIHPSVVFGVHFSPLGRGLLATGCHDGKVRVFDIESVADGPLHILSSHTDKVYNVLWHPYFEDVIVSGSNDKTVKVWTTGSAAGATGTPSLTGTMIGHTDKVRALCWSSLVPYVCLSGSWDGAIRAWDIRNFSCIAAVTEHTSDVYAITSHPDRPLVFCSASRDTTIRFWYMSKFACFHMDAAVGILPRDIKDPVALMAPGAVGCAGPNIAALQNVIGQCTDNSSAAQKMLAVADFFEFPHGVVDLVQCALSHLDKAHKPSAKLEVQPLSTMRDASQAKAQQLMGETKTVSSAVGSSQREAKLLKAAQAFLVIGDYESYCNALVEAGEWERAVSAAPMVGVDYWRKMASECARRLDEQGDRRAADYYIMSHEAHKAADVLARTGEYTEAMLVVQECPQLDAVAMQSRPSQAQAALPTIPPKEANAKLLGFAEEKAHSYERAGNPHFAAAAFIAAGDTNKAVDALLRGNSIPLAYALIHAVPTDRALIDRVMEAAMLRCAQCGTVEGAALCGALISTKFAACGILTSVLYGQREQVPPDYAATHAVFGVEPPERYGSECKADDINSILSACVGHHYGPASLAVLGFATAKFEGGAVPPPDQLKLLRDAFGWLAIETVSASEKPMLLHYSHRVGAHLAAQYGFNDITPALCRAARNQAPTTEATLEMYKLEMLAWARLGDMDSATQMLTESPGDLGVTLESLARMAEPFETKYNPLGCGLPCDVSRHTSCVSGKDIFGLRCILEDGASCMSLGEALEWVQCSWYSPLPSGHRVNPY